ncbi:hypothetical protein SHI21_19760 [Bacteriovorax sp. PP10]|uniref:Uncharacterized protein n=1 Tax=Bacteriovorax antarcticus TaxID=3088717 RepID=A0ABU5VZI7_9BACT|nr:hypothetical protein [Bacteriovorax sp. PP10]MEA9358483.1 hypothetical protein [Bacteriovorax sp. PP10]
MNVVRKKCHASRWMFSTSGVWLVGLGFYFIAFRPPLLPEDPRFMGASLTEIQTALPGLESWLKKVFIVMGGFMASTGVLILFLASIAIPQRLKGTSWAIALSGALSVLLMSAINFSLHSDFKWMLLVPSIFWTVGFVLYLLDR